MSKQTYSNVSSNSYAPYPEMARATSQPSVPEVPDEDMEEPCTPKTQARNVQQGPPPTDQLLRTGLHEGIDPTRGQAPHLTDRLRAEKGKRKKTPDPNSQEAILVAKLVALRMEVVAPLQTEAKGTVNFPLNGFPRCLLTQLLWPTYLDHHKTAVQTMSITTAEITHFGKGLEIAKEEGLIDDDDFDPAHYTYIEPPQPSKAFLPLAKDKGALRCILKKKVFIQANQTWGIHIVYNVKCGGSDFKKQILPLIYKALGSFIATKECDTKNTKKFASFWFHQVPFCEKTHKGVMGIMWQVAFKPTDDVNKTTWILPRNLGKSGRGIILLAQLPLCSHCISYSHSQHLCKWWEPDSVAGSKMEPDKVGDTERKRPAI
ncbi:hypothetical protein M407DRAFT_9859 [Tulasnella calospora MUT 4182]|uniref:Uncharacterized protein n=1 Tax=Tulasnella calospora MUT 4182 TaxID=1051891 RepID=A0A0C3Q2D0_9AGAM|nr:hypothetical protein M407DRAFT_9859 [Tulasnella calospora MUT 4182]